MNDNGALKLEVTDFTDADHWRWRLTDPNGAFLADHEVALDRSQTPYTGFVDLQGYLHHYAAPDRRFEDEARLLGEVGAWIGEQVLGPIGPAILDYGTPVTVQVLVPPEAETILYRPLELAHVEGKPLAVQDVSLVFEVKGEERRVRWRDVGKALRVLAVFSLPTDVRALALRRERYALQQLMRTIAQTYGLAIDLRVVQYGVTRKRLGDVLREGEGWSSRRR